MAFTKEKMEQVWKETEGFEYAKTYALLARYAKSTPVFNEKATMVLSTAHRFFSGKLTRPHVLVIDKLLTDFQHTLLDDEYTVEGLLCGLKNKIGASTVKRELRQVLDFIAEKTGIKYNQVDPSYLTNARYGYLDSQSP